LSSVGEHLSIAGEYVRTTRTRAFDTYARRFLNVTRAFDVCRGPRLVWRTVSYHRKPIDRILDGRTNVGDRRVPRCLIVVGNRLLDTGDTAKRRTRRFVNPAIRRSRSGRATTVGGDGGREGNDGLTRGFVRPETVDVRIKWYDDECVIN